MMGLDKEVSGREGWQLLLKEWSGKASLRQGHVDAMTHPGSFRPQIQLSLLPWLLVKGSSRVFLGLSNRKPNSKRLTPRKKSLSKKIQG